MCQNQFYACYTQTFIQAFQQPGVLSLWVHGQDFNAGRQAGKTQTLLLLEYSVSAIPKIKGHTQCWVIQILAKSCMDAIAVNGFLCRPTRPSSPS